MVFLNKLASFRIHEAPKSYFRILRWKWWLGVFEEWKSFFKKYASERTHRIGGIYHLHPFQMSILMFANDELRFVCENRPPEIHCTYTYQLKISVRIQMLSIAFQSSLYPTRKFSIRSAKSKILKTGLSKSQKWWTSRGNFVQESVYLNVLFLFVVSFLLTHLGRKFCVIIS